MRGVDGESEKESGRKKGRHWKHERRKTEGRDWQRQSVIEIGLKSESSDRNTDRNIKACGITIKKTNEQIEREEAGTYARAR